MLLDESEFMAGQTPILFDLGHNRAGHHRRPWRRSGFRLPSARNRHVFSYAFHGVIEVAHEIASAEFAIGKDLEAKLLLPLDDSQDVLVLKRAQLRGVYIRGARLEKLSGTKKTADMIGTISGCHN